MYNANMIPCMYKHVNYTPHTKTISLFGSFQLQALVLRELLVMERWKHGPKPAKAWLNFEPGPRDFQVDPRLASNGALLAKAAPEQRTHAQGLNRNWAPTSEGVSPKRGLLRTRNRRCSWTRSRPYPLLSVCLVCHWGKGKQGNTRRM